MTWSNVNYCNIDTLVNHCVDYTVGNQCGQNNYFNNSTLNYLDHNYQCCLFTATEATNTVQEQCELASSYDSIHILDLGDTAIHQQLKSVNQLPEITAYTDQQILAQTEHTTVHQQLESIDKIHCQQKKIAQ